VKGRDDGNDTAVMAVILSGAVALSFLAAACCMVCIRKVQESTIALQPLAEEETGGGFVMHEQRQSQASVMQQHGGYGAHEQGASYVTSFSGGGDLDDSSAVDDI
jgi:hypothetical protein